MLARSSCGKRSVAVVPLEPTALIAAPSHRSTDTSLKVTTKTPFTFAFVCLTHSPSSVTVTCSRALKFVPRTENGASDWTRSPGFVLAAAGIERASAAIAATAQDLGPNRIVAMLEADGPASGG